MSWIGGVLAISVAIAGISGESAPAKEEIGVRLTVAPQSVKHLNELFAARPLEFEAFEHYHVGIGMIQGVPKEHTKKLLEELHHAMKEARDVEKHPLRFKVADATTFHRIGSDNYSGESLILLPSKEDAAALIELNASLSRFVKHKAKTSDVFRGIHLDRPTSPEKFIPHITVQTPTANRKKIVDFAVAEIARNPNKYHPTVSLSKYGISVHEGE